MSEARRISDRDIAIFRNEQGENIPVPPLRKRPSSEESRIQCAVIVWWAAACAAFGVPEFLLFSIPNGAYTGPIIGKKLKREGLRTGTSDLFLSVMRRGRGGLYIEMKRPNGRTSPEQIRFLAEVVKQGYDSHECYSFEEATTLISDYLNGTEVS
jgi:hypothetical protein